MANVMSHNFGRLVIYRPITMTSAPLSRLSPRCEQKGRHFDCFNDLCVKENPIWCRKARYNLEEKQRQRKASV